MAGVRIKILKRAGEIITLRVGALIIRTIGAALTMTILRAGEIRTLAIISGEIIIIRAGGTIIHKIPRAITINQVVHGEITLPISRITHGGTISKAIKARPGATPTILHGEAPTARIQTITGISSLIYKRSLPTTTSTLTEIFLRRITTKTLTLHLTKTSKIRWGKIP